MRALADSDNKFGDLAVQKTFFITFWVLALTLILALPSSLSAFQGGGGNTNKDEVFSLETVDGDSPNIIKFKAALRIFAGVQAVYHLTSKCNAKPTWEQYEKRNGNTLAQVVKQFELGGGLGVPQKTAVDAYANGEVAEALSTKACAGLVADINSQEWDIYKGDRFKDDYSLIKAK
jgi:hypothetical protein